jgi:prepilin-type N-terminal cleavage/methylation domain-containing protein
MSNSGDIKKRGHRMLKRLKDRRGFTIIELMLVVCIIGVLSSIAIPTFLNFKERTKQTEAKVNLIGIFENEHAYFTEKNYFTEDMTAAGFGFAGVPKHYDFTCATPVSQSGTPPNISCNWITGSWMGLHGIPGDGPGAGSTFGLDDLPGAIGNYFTAIAVGNANTEGVYDVWEITDKGLLHCQSNAAYL